MCTVSEPHLSNTLSVSFPLLHFNMFLLNYEVYFLVQEDVIFTLFQHKPAPLPRVVDETLRDYIDGAL